MAEDGRRQQAETLRELVARSLSVEPERVAPEVPFVQLGSDSLALVELLRAIHLRFGVQISLRQLFEELPSIAALSEYLSARVAEVATTSQPAEPAAAPPRERSQPANPPTSPLPRPPRSPIPTGSSFERIFAAQLEAFEKLVAEQLRGLGNVEQPATWSQDSEGESKGAIPEPSSTPRSSNPLAPTRQGLSGPSPRQQAHLEELIERFTKRTPRSKELAQSSRAHLADSRSVVGFRPAIKEMLYPLARQRAAGARIWDLDDNEYVDITMGMGVHLFGHQPEFLRPVLEKHLQEGFELGPRSELAGRVAERLCRLTGMERAAFTNSGTEAVMTAVRLARAASGRTKIALFAGSYHGHSDGTLVRGQDVDGTPRSFPVSPGVPAAIAEDVLVLDYDEPRSLEILAARMGELAAVLVEPVQSRRPGLQPRQFLHDLRELTADAGVALIFDEMITGFRLHPGGAQAWFDVRADLATYGKVVGGGLPIGVVAGSAAYMDGIDGGYWRYGDDSRPQRDTTFFGGTFCQHPLAMATADAVLDYLEEQGPSLQEALNQRTTCFVDELNEGLLADQVPMRIDRCGSLFRFNFSADGELFFYHLLNRGVYVWEWRNCFLSTAHTDADLEAIGAAIRETVTEMREGGYLLPPSVATSAVSEESLRPEEAPASPRQPSAAHDPRLAFFGRGQMKPGLGSDAARALQAPRTAREVRHVDFSLYYFGRYEAEWRPDKYDLLIDGARFADQHGFAAVWFPERHFHPFGGLSPNPSVLAAALARETETLELRAGSVVLPLHHPVRVAEEWALVDNLSDGRVALSLASGWHPNDFVLAPEAFGRHREMMFEHLDPILALWRGEAVEFPDGTGKPVAVRLHPQPKRRRLPIWITAVNNPDTYRRAGELGAGILTNLMGQTLDVLASNIAVYEQALADAGHPADAARVTVLLHAHVAEDAHVAIERARAPFRAYLESSVGLLKNLIKTQGVDLDLERLSDEDRDYMLDRAYERYVQNSALIGSPESCAKVVESLAALGVNEVACLIDFGVEAAAVMESLPYLDSLRQQIERELSSEDGRRFDLTPGQKQLQTVVLLESAASAAYNEPALLRVEGTLEAHVLEEALQHLVQRHAALRTVLLRDGDQQEVRPVSFLAMPLVDLARCPEETAEPLARRLLRDALDRPMDLFAGPVLARAMLVRLHATRHLIALTIHHLAADGLSIGILFRELLAIYGARLRGAEAQLPTPYRYRRYVEWLQGDGAWRNEDEQYWLGQFEGDIPIFEPSSDRPRPPARTFRGRLQRARFDRRWTALVEELGRRQGCTFFVTALAAYGALMHRWTGQGDIVVGVAVARRPAEARESLVGHCVDSMPIRTLATASQSFSSYLLKVRGLLLDAHEHSAYPLALLIKKLNPTRELSRAPLINTLFNFDQEAETPPGVDLRVRRETPAIRNIKYDVAAHGFRSGEELVIDLESSSDLFDATTGWRLLRSFASLLESAADNVDQPLAALSWLSRVERHQVDTEWVHGHLRDQPPQPSFLHRIVDHQAELTSEAVALVHGSSHLTYGELARRSDRFAAGLSRLGVRPEVAVGLCCERGLMHPIALLGIFKAGGVYVPFDHGTPLERLSFMIEDAGVEHLLADDPAAFGIEDLQPPSLSLSAVMDLGKEVVVPLRPPLSQRHLAYVIYTSGSTGKPKGIAMSHSGILSLIPWQLAAASVRGAARTLQFSAPAFDILFQESFVTWSRGGTLVLVDRATRTDFPALLSYLGEQRVERLFLPFVALQEIAQAADERDGLPANLRQVITAGEQLRVTRSLAELFRKQPDCRLENQYGPTEAHVVTAYPLPADVSSWPPLPPVGRPIRDLCLHLVDRAMQPVPIGVAGEVFIRGSALARGYLGRPAVTAAVFLPDPWSLVPGERIYRTGDLGRHASGGEIQFTGRVDHQVKVRGFRIELGEVEAALTLHPKIRQAVVVMRGEPRRLAAYLVGAEQEAQPRAQSLRKFLRRSLPSYMVPSSFTFLDALPLNPSSKLNMRRLPEPAVAEAAQATVQRDPVEELLLALWAQLLSSGEAEAAIDVHDDFFALGGHSLIATQVVARVRRQLGVELPLRLLFEHPTVAGLAAAVRRGLVESPVTPPPPMFAGPRPDQIPLSFAQQRLWFLAELRGADPVYNRPAAWHLQGPIDTTRLMAALGEIVRRHEVLRTTYPRLAGESEQRISRRADFEFGEVDVSRLSFADRRSEAQRIVDSEAWRPFDLERDVMLRALLLRGPDDDHVLFLNLHHIAYDGWSEEVFYNELEALYGALHGCTADFVVSPLPELPAQYADFTLWQRSWLASGALEPQLRYWRRQLHEAPVLELPLDRPRQAMQTSNGAILPVRLKPSSTRQLRQQTAERGTSLFMVLLAVTMDLLRRLAGQRDVVVGSPIANRLDRDLEGMLGFFVNNLVLRGDLSPTLTLTDLTEHLREVCLAAYGHQDVPFERLVEELQPDRDLSRSPLFQVILAFQKTPRQSLHAGGWTGKPMEIAVRVATVDLELHLWEAGETLEGFWNYNTDLFDATTVARLLSGFGCLLDGALGEPEVPLREISMLDRALRHQLLVEWSNSAPQAVDEAIPDLVHRQIAARPDAIAVVDGDRHLSYRSLGERAMALATALTDLDLEAGRDGEIRVGVCVERSLELVISILGILESGGGYVPLDPEYPKQRLALMAVDVEMTALITSPSLRDRLPEVDLPVLDLSALGLPALGLPALGLPALGLPALGLSEEEPAKKPRRTSPDELAYVMFTSGSTGRPKGVAVPHRAVVRLVERADFAELGSDQIWLQLAPASFDASTLEIWGALARGGKLVIAPPGPLSPHELGGLLRRARINSLWLTAGLFHQAVAEIPEDLRAVQQLLAGGDVLSVEHVANLLEGGYSGLINGYGPTENTTFTACARLRSSEDLYPSAVIGRPIAGTWAAIVDGQQRAVPTGAIGELVTGGEGLSRGYVGAPAATAERFVPAAGIASRQGERMYCTGDRARHRSDGRLEFFGRGDRQLKLRGFRVEPGEIEAELARLDGIREAVVVAHGTEGETTLVGYVVPLADVDASPEVWRDQLADRLPAYMVPSRLAVVEELPLSPTGKIDRSALPELAEVATKRHIEPRHPIEESLVEIWKETLQHIPGRGIDSPISVEDHFFKLGGHSLLATRVLSRIRRRFGVALELRIVFEKPTLAQLAQVVADASSSPRVELESTDDRAVIERALRSRRSIREALVVGAREGEVAEDDELTAYVVLPASEREEYWRSRHDDIFSDPTSHHGNTLDTRGLPKNLHGEPLSQLAVRDWLTHTASRLRDLEPRRVLEVGCGSGLLMQQLAPVCEHYVGVDISSRALRCAAAQYSEAELVQTSARDLSPVRSADFDTVILGSVVQFFPGPEYLIRALRAAIEKTAAGGTVVITDVQSLGLFEASCAAAELALAEHYLPVGELKARILRRRHGQRELFIDPLLFTILRAELPRTRAVRVAPKRGRASELTTMSYDVFLYLDEPSSPNDAGPTTKPKWLRGHRGLTASSLRESLQVSRPSALGALRVTNRRTHRSMALVDLLRGSNRSTPVEDLRLTLAGQALEGCDPEELHRIGESLGYEVELSWAHGGAGGAYDAYFWHRERTRRPSWPQPMGPADLPWRSLANDPLTAAAERRLIPELRRQLEKDLPRRRRPVHYVGLESLPRRPDGTIDHDTLPAPEERTAAEPAISANLLDSPVGALG